jgi:hypothetical protein
LSSEIERVQEATRKRLFMERRKFNRKEIQQIRDYLGDDQLRYNQRMRLFTVESEYFYTFGRSATILGKEVEGKLLKGLFLQITIADKGDHFAAWPKRSFFWVKFYIPQTEKLVQEVSQGLEHLKQEEAQEQDEYDDPSILKENEEQERIENGNLEDGGPAV